MSDKPRNFATPGVNRRRLMAAGTAGVVSTMLPVRKTRAASVEVDPGNWTGS
jgi:hypothetical protein